MHSSVNRGIQLHFNMLKSEVNSSVGCTIDGKERRKIKGSGGKITPTYIGEGRGGRRGGRKEGRLLY